jgi:hypothetical protein
VVDYIRLYLSPYRYHLDRVSPREYHLAKAITLLVRNIVERMKFTCTMIGYFVHAAKCN